MIDIDDLIARTKDTLEATECLGVDEANELLVALDTAGKAMDWLINTLCHILRVTRKELADRIRATLDLLEFDQ